MNKLKRYLKLYKLYFITHMKSKMTYKRDFLIGSFSELVDIALSLAFFGLIYTQVDSLSGWTLNELLLLYGYGTLIFQLHDALLFGPWIISTKIQKGSLDRLFLRPVNILFSVYANTIHETKLIKSITGVVLILHSANTLGIQLLAPIKILYILMALISGLMTIAGIFLAISTLAFWIGKTRSIFKLWFKITSFKKYPYSIYNIPVKTLLVTVVPVAIATFFPATFLLGRSTWINFQIISLVTGPIFFIIGYSFWKKGLNRYTSTGS